MIDPPWPKKKGGRRNVRPNQNRELDYQTLSVESCFDLLDKEVFPSGKPSLIVYLWTIDEFLQSAENAMTARGFRRHARIIWDKTNGVAPAFSIRYTHEYLLWFYRPSWIPVTKESRGKLPTVWSEKAREHSRKPDIAYTNISLLYPDTKKLDVFSRESREGWDQWGNQTDFFMDK